jgi:hypothetical protein
MPEKPPPPPPYRDPVKKKKPYFKYLALTGILSYLIGAFFMYGHTYNNTLCKPNINFYDCEWAKNYVAIRSAIFWHFILIGDLSIALTK